MNRLWLIPLSTVCYLTCLSQESSEKIEGTPLTLEQAIVITLENNVSLLIDKLDPEITRLGETIAEAAFDPTLSGGVDYLLDDETNTQDVERSAGDLSFDTGLSKRFSTGTRVNVDVAAKRDETTASNSDDKLYTDSLNAEIRITQSLLQGRGRDVNLAAVRRARINTAISEYQLRRFIETLINSVTNSYWDLFLEQQKLKVYQESYQLALDHEREMRLFIANGKRPEIELATVQAEVSSRRERLIKSRGDINKQRISLLSIMNYQTLAKAGWDEHLLPIDLPESSYAPLDGVDTYIQIAMEKRPEVRDYELRLEREQINLVVTKNGLLPRLDFFISLGATEYSNSFIDSETTDNSEQNLALGLSYSFPVGRRADKARLRQGLIVEEQAQLALQNLRDSINREVRRAYIDCITNLESIEAVTATRQLREQSLRTQMIKFENGTATNNAIANAQRDLLQSQINETEALVEYVLSRIRLHYLDGSLIERMGIVLPAY